MAITIAMVIHSNLIRKTNFSIVKSVCSEQLISQSNFSYHQGFPVSRVWKGQTKPWVPKEIFSLECMKFLRCLVFVPLTCVLALHMPACAVSFWIRFLQRAWCLHLFPANSASSASSAGSLCLWTRQGHKSLKGSQLFPPSSFLYFFSLSPVACVCMVAATPVFLLPARTHDNNMNN